MFYGASSFDGNLSSWNVANVEEMQYSFDNARNFTGRGLGQWNVHRVKSMTNMFRKTLISNVSFAEWDVSNCRSMSQMFQGAQLFQGNGLSNWTTISVNKMEEMFDDAKSFDADLSDWDVSNVTLMTNMFRQTNAFKGIGLDQWNISNVNSADGMFCQADGLTMGKENLSSWVISLADAFLCN